jgi:hypothetical protein
MRTNEILATPRLERYIAHFLVSLASKILRSRVNSGRSRARAVETKIRSVKSVALGGWIKAGFEIEKNHRTEATEGTEDILNQ